MSTALSVIFVLLSVVDWSAVAVNSQSQLPILGWSSWNSVTYYVNESFIMESASLLAQHLLSSGYEYILIDDGWPACLKYARDGGCDSPHPRNASTQAIVVDEKKFPNGFNHLTSYVHSLGLKIGIYTAVSKTTCGGFTASLYYEAIDAQSFVDYGFDFVKHDTCNADCGSRDGCIQNSTYWMGHSLKEYGGNAIIYYVDDGNPSTSMRLWNPTLEHITYDNYIKIAAEPAQRIYNFVNEAPFLNSSTNETLIYMFKSWFDREDDWDSVMDNLHKQIGLQMYQSCGTFNMADMLTTAQGHMDFHEYRAEFLLWSVLATPLIFGATLPKLLAGADILQMITNAEILAVNQDVLCVEGSLLRINGSTELWGKPLANNDIAVVFLNKSPDTTQTIRLNAFGNRGDLYPMYYTTGGGTFQARDVFNQTELGRFQNSISVVVAPRDARMLRLSNFTPEY